MIIPVRGGSSIWRRPEDGSYDSKDSGVCRKRGRTFTVITVMMPVLAGCSERLAGHLEETGGWGCRRQQEEEEGGRHAVKTYHLYLQ